MASCPLCNSVVLCAECMAATANVEGVDTQDYLDEVEFSRILPASEKEQRIHTLMQQIQSDLMNGFEYAGSRNLKDTVQLASNLFEVVAAITAITHGDLTQEEQSKLEILHQHALSGLGLVHGYEDTEGDD